MNVGAAIKQLRKDRGLNQEQLSELTSITQTYLSQIETGTRTAHTGTLLTIAAKLNVSLAVIYVMAIGQEDITRNDPANNAILSMLEAGKQLLLNAL